MNAQVGGWIDRESLEWSRAWNALLVEAALPDHEQACPTCGEGWQYMGSPCIDGRYVHEFRHRCGHSHGIRRNVRIAATPGWPCK